MNVIVYSGSRWANTPEHQEIISTSLTLENPSLVVSGGAQGFDYMVEQLCKQMAIPNLSVPAEWGKLGKSAGPERNRKMLKMASNFAKSTGSTIRLLAYPASNLPSKGTLDCIKKAGLMKIQVEVTPITVEQPEVWT